jgi:hypothetical protein
MLYNSQENVPTTIRSTIKLMPFIRPQQKTKEVTDGETR